MGKRQMPNFSFEVWSINHRRMAALEELRFKMDVIASDAQRLKQRLLVAASPGAREFLEQTTIIQDLFAYGLSELKIDVGDYDGLNSCASIKRVLKNLRMAWSGAVEVEIGHAEGGRVEVKFRAIGL